MRFFKKKCSDSYGQQKKKTTNNCRKIKAGNAFKQKMTGLLTKSHLWKRSASLTKRSGPRNYKEKLKRHVSAKIANFFQLK